MLPSRDGALDTGTEDVAAEQHPDVLIRNLVELVQVLVDGRGEAGCASHGLMLLGANMVNIVEMDDVDGGGHFVFKGSKGKKDGVRGKRPRCHSLSFLMASTNGNP